MADIKIDVHEDIGISDSVRIRSENVYLLVSHREKCKQIARKRDLSDNELIDFLTSLHIVLEVGLNAFYRHVALASFRKDVHEVDVMKNLDKVSFIDKTVLFIYFSKFDFGDRLGEATKFHGIIERLRDFASTRNLLLHGHAIVSVIADGSQRDSDARKHLTKEKMETQIEKFKNILDGVAFYFDCLVSGFTTTGKADIKKEYLDTNFLAG